jgi:hypothetical protein
MRLRSSTEGAGKGILDELKAINFRFGRHCGRESYGDKFGTDYGSSDGGGSFEVNEGANAA